MEIFAYLSVLVSIIIGLGISHLLKAIVRVIHDRATQRVFVPSLLWAASLFLLFTLVWWSSFSLTNHRDWTFADFFLTLSVPAVLYVVSGLILPQTESGDEHAMRGAFFTNRVWIMSLSALAVALSFVQTLFLDGHIALSVDSVLKALLIALFLAAVFVKAQRFQYIVSVSNLAWVLFYIALLFSRLKLPQD